jgi:hypothetical protein
MTVYLGTHGTIELQRQSATPFFELELKSDDVDTTKKRFSFHKLLHGDLVTGDKIKITADSSLGLISGSTEKSTEKYIHVDTVDGIRLYDTFAKAVNGTQADAETLTKPSSNLSVKVEILNDARIIAQVKSFELNTERETVDTTTLSDDFRNRISTLISGSGRISAFWEYTGDTTREVPNYILQLVLRTKVGSNFKGRFFLKVDDYNPSGVSARANDLVFYDIEGMLTSAAVQFAPDNVVEIAADFVTTGAIQLRMVTEPPVKLLNEDGTSMVLKPGSTAKLGIT